MTPVVLVLNGGSSTVKFKLLAPGEDGSLVRALARGIVERIGGDSRLELEGAGRVPVSEPARIEDHGAAVRLIMEWLQAGVAGGAVPGIDAVGHRVVHGGDRFRESVLIDAGAVRAIEQLGELAPLHNGPGLAGIRAAREALGPSVPMVAVFDTAFHATLPERAYRYAIPYELSIAHGVRRFGFHGTSYRSVLEQLPGVAGLPVEAARVIALHLGNGCSAAAIRCGESVDTSMGFTPLEGLVMGTRSGDLDPALVAFLAERQGLSLDAVLDLLNRESGLLGLSGATSDMRDLVPRADGGDPRARLALEVFCYRARKYVGAYLAALGGADALVFTGGIGEHAPAVRARICEGLEFAGLRLDAGRNGTRVGRAGRISAEGAALRAYVIRTDEEAVIAADTIRVGGLS